MAFKWCGPFFVLDVLSDINFRVIRNQASKPKVVHHDRMKRYHFRDGAPNIDWVIHRSKTVSAEKAKACREAPLAGAGRAMEKVVNNGRQQSRVPFASLKPSGLIADPPAPPRKTVKVQYSTPSQTIIRGRHAVTRVPSVERRSPENRRPVKRNRNPRLSCRRRNVPAPTASPVEHRSPEHGRPAKRGRPPKRVKRAHNGERSTESTTTVELDTPEHGLFGQRRLAQRPDTTVDDQDSNEQILPVSEPPDDERLHRSGRRSRRTVISALARAEVS